MARCDDLLEHGGLVDLLPEDNVLGRGGRVVDGVHDDVQVLHDAGRHQESMLG